MTSISASTLLDITPTHPNLKNLIMTMLYVMFP